MSKREVRNYDEEFKCNAVSLYLNSGKSCPALAKELGIPISTLGCWVNNGKYHTSTGKRKITAAELEELKMLRKELIHVKMERDILKKAVAIFVKPKKGTGSSL